MDGGGPAAGHLAAIEGRQPMMEAETGETAERLSNSLLKDESVVLFETQMLVDERETTGVENCQTVGGSQLILPSSVDTVGGGGGPGEEEVVSCYPSHSAVIPAPLNEEPGSSIVRDALLPDVLGADLPLDEAILTVIESHESEASRTIDVQYSPTESVLSIGEATAAPVPANGEVASSGEGVAEQEEEVEVLADSERVYSDAGPEEVVRLSREAVPGETAVPVDSPDHAVRYIIFQLHHAEKCLKI